MSNRGAAGTTISFDGNALGLVENITASVNGDEIDVTTLAALRAEYDAGQDDIEVEISIVGNGAHALARGDAGDIVMTPNDASGAKTWTNMIVLGLTHNAPKRGQLSSTVRFKAAFT